MNIKEIPNYELVSEKRIEDLNSYSYLLKHKKTGAKVAVLENDDNNKVFYIGFRTPPKNSTGVAHILEHSVLCGSEKFPTKDPFADLCKSSLNTFLNAMTYPDKTVYPVASCNDKDFANLMHVYMDAVLKPNIYNEKKIFMQEGWHYELNDTNDDLKINGVVYNEMKGAFSSPDDVVDREILNSLFPDTAYGVESGGDPDYIPDLSYEEFLKFHSAYYHPSNSYIYLYGNADMAERLNWLDNEYLSKYEKITVDSFPGEQKAFDKARELKKSYPIADDDSEEFNTYLSYNTALFNGIDKKLRIAFSVIDYALCDAQGSPLKQALIDAGIGSEIVSTYENGIYQPYYSIVSKNANESDKEDFLEIISNVLNKVVKEGFDKNALKAGLNILEFKYRESDFASTPKGLVLGLTAFDSWLYEENMPFDYIECNDTFAELKELIDSDYYEKLVDKYLLNNKHKSIVTVVPEKGLTLKKDNELAKKLSEIKNSLTEEEILKVVEETKNLKIYQETPDSEENLSKIPRLSINDIDKKATFPVNKEVNFGDIKGLHHNVFTNGIDYISLMFKVPALSLETYSYFELANQVLGMMDTTKYSFEQLGYEINKITGGLGIHKATYGKHDDPEDYTVYSVIRFKSLNDNVEASFNLVKDILFDTKFDDYKRLKDILLELKSQKASSLMSSAHLTALNRCNSYVNVPSKISEYMHGIDYYRFLCELIDDFDNKKEEIINEVKKIITFIYRKENLFVDIISDAQGFNVVSSKVEDFASCLYKDAVSYDVKEIVLEKANEGITFSGMVQYVARTGNFLRKGLKYDPALRVLKTIMAYDFLWTEVRIKGGAYGCMNNYSRTGNSFFVSYRDPNLKETNDIYKKVSDYVASFDENTETITNYIIATIAELDTPFTPSTLGDFSLSTYLSGITDDILQADRDRILSVTAKDIQNLSKYVDAFLSDEIICVVGNENKINENKELFGNIISLLN